MVSERCNLTDLFPDECGCPRHRNSPPLDDPGDYRVESFFTAAYSTRCALNPAHPIHVGDDAGMAVTRDANGRTTRLGAVCRTCCDEARS